MGSYGRGRVGAVTGALFLPRLKARASANQIVGIGTLGTAVVTALFAVLSTPAFSLIAGFVFGLSWIFVLATINLSSQLALPEWVRGRGLALFLMVFFGSMTLGSAFWGWLAGLYGLKPALLLAAFGAVVCFILIRNVRLLRGKDLDHTLSTDWPEPILHTSFGDTEDRGPVIIQIAYIIDVDDRAAFLAAMTALRVMRLRNGAFDWMLSESTETPEVMIETFKELSWHQHLRHHDHITLADKPIHDKVRSFHRGPAKPVVQHFHNPIKTFKRKACFLAISPTIP